MAKNDKVYRVLEMYTKLMEGKILNKSEEAANYEVNERSIQRDIESIRNFLYNKSEKEGIPNSIFYDHLEKGYRLEFTSDMRLSNSEILAICKILLDSRAFTKIEMQEILMKLIHRCIPKSSRKLVLNLINNEEFHYIEPQHKTVFIDKMWEIGQAIQKCLYIEIEYERIKGKLIVRRKLKPLAIMFSEYYFYLTAFIDDKDVRGRFDVINDSFPTIYRIDRIRKLRVLKEHFHIPYRNRFEEGEFRKRIQFMYGGRLQKIKFKYKGDSVEAVLDRLPTAKIISENNEGYLISAEVFGKGVDMWIRSQGDLIEMQ